MSERVVELGPVFDINVLWEPMIFTTCPEHIQIILATDFQNYVKGTMLSVRFPPYASIGERFQEGMASMLGTGVFNADGSSLLSVYLFLTCPKVICGSETSHSPLGSSHRATGSTAQ